MKCFVPLGLSAFAGLAFIRSRQAMLGAITLGDYLLLYTPLKRVTPWNTLVGAVSGAMPVLMGWMSLTMASGLSLYFLVSNVVSVVQYAVLGKVNWSNLLPKFNRPVPMVLSGGTALPPGFRDRFDILCELLSLSHFARRREQVTGDAAHESHPRF